MKRWSLKQCLQGTSLVVAVVAVVAVAFATLPNYAALAAGVDTGAKMLSKLDDDWSKAAVAKDTDRVLSFYAVDAIVYPPNAPVAVGRDAAKQVWAGYFAAPDFAISWTTMHAGMSKSGDLGFTAGTYQDSYTGADGKPVKETGKYLCEWKKQKDGSWKAIHDMWNSDTK